VRDGRDVTARQPKLGLVVLHTKYQQEKGLWLGECLELGTATFADTFEEIQSELNEMILLHLQGLEDVGTRDSFFKKHGIKMYEPDQLPKTVKLEVPVHREPTWMPVFQTTQVVQLPASSSA